MSHGTGFLIARVVKVKILIIVSNHCTVKRVKETLFLLEIILKSLHLNSKFKNI